MKYKKAVLDSLFKRLAMIETLQKYFLDATRDIQQFTDFAFPRLSLA
jgi:hypothetical protein